MIKKESWFSVAIHPAFLIEDELEKSKRSAASKAAANATSSQLAFPDLGSKASEPVAPEPEAPAPQSPAERAASAQAQIRDGYQARTATKARIDALTQPEIEPVVPADIPAHARTERTFGRINDSLEPQIHPDDQIWPTGDSPSLVDRIRDSASAAGGHLKNLKDRLIRVFGSSPEAPASEVSASEASEPVSSEPATPAERAASARAQIRDGYQARREGDPDSQTLVQNLLNQPVAQVETADPEPEIAEERTQPEEKATVGGPLPEIRTLGDAKIHFKKMIKLHEDALAAADDSIDGDAARAEAQNKMDEARDHMYGHQDFEDAHTTPLLHGRVAINTLKEDDTYHPVSSKSIGDHSRELNSMANAMQQGIEDAGGIHEAMKDPELAPKIRLVHEAEEHMRETFPGSYDAMKSDEHDGDVLERPLEGIRNTADAFDHAQKADAFFRDESHKFDAMADGSQEKKAQRLLLEKAGEAHKRAFAHWNALDNYQYNNPELFSSYLDAFDPKNMSEEDREKYRIHMNAVNTVLKQKIEAAGGKDYAQYNPRIKAFQDRIRQIAEAHQAANPEAWERARRASAATRSDKPWGLAPYYGDEHMWNLDQLRDESQRGRTWPAGQASSNQFDRVESNRGMLRQREASAQELSRKRQEEIAKEQERQKNLQELMDGLAPSVGSIKRRR